MAPVVAKAYTMTRPPDWDICIYAFNIGPSEKPSKPVKAKTQPKAAGVFATLCKRHKVKNATSMQTIPVMGGGTTAIEIPAVSALKITVIDNSM